MKCVTCGNENPKDGQFCGGCGASLSVPAASSTGVESAELPMTEDRRQLRPDEHFCSSCGEIIKKLAEICPKCGVRLRDAPDREKVSGKTSRGIKILVSAVVSLIVATMFTFDLGAFSAFKIGGGPTWAVFAVILASSTYYCSRADSGKRAFARGCFLYALGAFLLPIGMVVYGWVFTAEAEAEAGAVGAIGGGLGALTVIIVSIIWAVFTGTIGALLGFFLSRD